MENPSSVNVCGDEKLSLNKADDERDQETDDYYDYFCPALMDCWPKVFDCLTKYEDLQSLSNTSRLFNDMLQPRLAGLVVPIVIRKGYLNRNTLLASRRLNRKTKLVVDDFLLNSPHPKPAWLSEAFKLGTKDKINQFVFNFAHCNLENSLSSRLLRLGLNDTEDFERSMDLFQQHGSHLKSIGLQLSFTENSSQLCYSLTRLLSCVPNVQALLLEMGLQVGGAGDLGRYAGAFSFPPLSLLSNLNLVARSPGVTGVLEQVVQTYGPQLEEMGLHPDVSGGDIQVSNWQLEKLLKLTVSGIDCYKIFQFKMQKLETLSFSNGYIEPDAPQAVTVFRRPPDL